MQRGVGEEGCREVLGKSGAETCGRTVGGEVMGKSGVEQRWGRGV